MSVPQNVFRALEKDDLDTVWVEFKWFHFTVYVILNVVWALIFSKRPNKFWHGHSWVLSLFKDYLNYSLIIRTSNLCRMRVPSMMRLNTDNNLSKGKSRPLIDWRMLKPIYLAAILPDKFTSLWVISIPFSFSSYFNMRKLDPRWKEQHYPLIHVWRGSLTHEKAFSLWNIRLCYVFFFCFF